MAAHYKLTYFNITGLAEGIRYLFIYGKTEFEDIRIEEEQWPALKSNMPYGQLPILEHKGKTYHQSKAIGRYVAKITGMTGRTDLDDIVIDSTVDTIADLFQKTVNFYYEPDPEIKKARKEQYLNETLPYYMKRLEFQAATNCGYLVGTRLSWADFFLAGSSGYISFMAGKDIFSYAPTLKSLTKLVHELPRIKEYLAQRPKVP